MPSLTEADHEFPALSYTSTLIVTANTNPFDIDPGKPRFSSSVTPIPSVSTPADPPILTTNTNPFDIDPEQTTPITTGLTAAD